MSRTPTKTRRHSGSRERANEATSPPSGASLAPGRPLEAFFESALDAILVIDDAGRYVEANPAACELLGVSRELIVGRHVQEFAGPLDASARFAQFRKAGRTSGVGRLHRPDGEVRDVEYASTADVLPGLHLSILRDVTARLRAEKELERRVGELQRIYDLANAVSRAVSLEEICEEALDALTDLGADRGSVLLFDADGVMRFKASRGISEAYRRKAEGHSPWSTDAKDPRPVLVPDVRAEPTLSALAEFIVDEGIHALAFIPLVDEGRLLGKLMTYYDAPHPFTPDEVRLAEMIAHHVAFVIARKRADSALRDSEGELAEFFENASIPIHWEGPDGTVLRVNRAELDLLGYSREEYVGRPIAEFHADRGVIDDILSRLAAGENLESYPARLRAKDGSVKQVLIDSSVYFREGEFVHTRCFTRDVTDLAAADARQRTQYLVTRALAEKTSPSDAAPKLLRAICEGLGWDTGALWLVDPVVGVLRCVDVAHRPDVQVPAFEALTREMTFRTGVGMPGRVWESRKPTWISNVQTDDNFPRRPAAIADGLHASCAFPIETPERFIGVIEFFSREVRPVDPDLLESLIDFGSRVGQSFEGMYAAGALRESEERYRALFDANPVAMWLRDPETLTFVAVNDAALRQYGYTRDEFLKLTIRDILAPEDLESASLRWDRTTSMEPWNEGIRKHRRKDGRTLWVEVSGRDVSSSGRPLRLILAKDVTERLRTEEEDRFLDEATVMLGSSLEDGVTLHSLARLAVPRIADWCLIDLLDSQGTPTRVAVAHTRPEREHLARRYPINPHARYGVYPVLRSGQPELVPEPSDEMIESVAWDAEHAELLKREIGSYMCVPLKARDRMLGTITLVLSPGEGRYGASDLALAQELGRRAALAVDNARLFAEAREASAQKSRFLSAVSHDLRTPASAITLLSSLVRKDAAVLDGAGPLLERCQRLELAATSFADLLSDLLEIGSFDSGQKKMRDEAFSLEEAVAATVETCAPSAREKGLQIRVRWETPPSKIRADRTEFARVLLNLVSNAVKFTERGIVNVEVSRSGNGDLDVRVRDTGPGIPTEHLPSVFSEFFQVRNAERDRSKGSGLGLAISRRIMQALGGSLKVESRIGAGSTFTATLPSDRVLAPDEGTTSAPERSHPPASPFESRRILVIDDDATSREALSILLAEEGFEVLTAPGGEEGLEIASAQKPDVLLLDMMMPGMDGLEVIRRIRGAPELENVRIVVLTGDVTRERLQNVLESGADQFVAKPFRIPALLESVRAILRPR